MNRRAKRCVMTPLALLLVSIAFCTRCVQALADPLPRTGTIRGRVVDAGTGEPYDQHYPAFHRADLRISRHFDISKGRVSAFLEIVNLYNHGNVRTYMYNVSCSATDECRLLRTPEYWFRLLPSIGASWSWGT